MAERPIPARINLIGWDNGRGLSHDLRLLRETLESLGHEVHLSAVGPSRRRFAAMAVLLRLQLWWHWLRGRRRGSWRFDASIMLEHVQPAYLGMARRDLFIPNPEWLSPRDERHLHRFDALLVKTHVAAATFQARGLRTLYIGFRSSDCRLPELARQPRFLHLAGASRMKGTERLLALWRRHPEWPPLLALQSPLTARRAAPAAAGGNLEHRITTAEEVEIRQLQNSHLFHLCLSEVEGWGHYIAEAMSCGVVVITCDAPPMNELVGPERGLLVSATAVGSLNLATRYQFDEAALEATIEHARTLRAEDRAAIGAGARAWFEASQREFAKRLQQALQELL